MIDFTSKIVKYDVKKASEFRLNPLNMRTHPAGQKRALTGSLNTLGWIDVVLENEVTGNLIDGHERIELALENEDADVPYILLHLTPEEEYQALLIFDEIGTMAFSDVEQIQENLRLVTEQDKDVVEFLGMLRDKEGLLSEPPELDDLIGKYGDTENADFDPTIVMKVSKTTFTRWQGIWETLEGDNSEKVSELVARAIEKIS